MAVTISVVDAEMARTRLSELVLLLQDAVDDGASVGFLPPLAAAEASAYWQGVLQELAAAQVVLLVATVDGQGLVGSVQLVPAGRANGRHRAEVAKLLVLRSARRQGIGRALMLALEEEARRLGRTTLVLDTRAGDGSEQLYAGLGWTRVGEIPAYARSASGQLDGTGIYYKVLG